MIKRYKFLLLSLLSLVVCKDGITLESNISTSSVTTSRVGQNNVPLLYSAIGYIKASRSVDISTSQLAKIEILAVKEGDRIVRGDLLIDLERAELLASIKAAQEAIYAAEIYLNDVNTDLKKAQNLLKKNLISPEDVRKLRVKYDIAHTQLARAQQHLLSQKSREAYHVITSPIDGVVTKRWVEQGDMAIPGRPLIQLKTTESAEFETFIPAKWANKINIGEKHFIRLHHNNRVIEATVSHIVKNVDFQTQTVQIRLIIDASTDIESGLSGKVDFIVDTQKQLLVAEDALVKRAGVFGVFKVTDNRATFTPVNVERSWQGYRIILSGLKVGDEIIHEPSSKLRDSDLINRVSL